MKVDSLIKHLKKYNSIAFEVKSIIADQPAKSSRLVELTDQIRNDLCISLKSPEMIGLSARLTIVCGEEEEEFTSDRKPGSAIELKYHVPDHVEDLTQGKLVPTAAE